ncbi:MAG: hypothetical protein L0271_14745, partial [Gemmatimonadetes bacterium]|nr:hypothetical protein [Gemmatimonadota bacterium]
MRYVVNQQAYYSPLGWDESAESEGGGYFYSGDQRIEGELRLDAQGRGEIRVPLEVDKNASDYSARIEAQVTDASSREVSGNTIVHATYGPFLISAQTSGYIFRASQAVPVTLRALDYTGNPQGSIPVTVRLARITYPEGRYSEPTATEVGRVSATTATDGTAAATVTLPAQSGSYRIRVVAMYEAREIRGYSWVWVPGGAPGQDVDDGDRYLELLADKRSYAPGDTARVIIRGEPVSGPILVTKEGQHVTWHRVLRPSASDALEVPIVAGDIGDIYV